MFSKVLTISVGRPSYQWPTERPTNQQTKKPSYQQPAASSHWKPPSPESPTSNSASNNHYHIHVEQANQIPQVEAALNSIGSEPQANPRPPNTGAQPYNPPSKQPQYQPTNILGQWRPKIPLKAKHPLSTAQKLMCLFWCYLDQDNIWVQSSFQAILSCIINVEFSPHSSYKKGGIPWSL